jgi:hypothetical protein
VVRLDCIISEEAEQRGVPVDAEEGSIRIRPAVSHAGAGPNVCYTALSSAKNKQQSATAHCHRAFQRNPCKGGVTNIRACTSVNPPPT